MRHHHSQGRFYSLHRETYSVTGSSAAPPFPRTFLFAASRDVQRDAALRRTCQRIEPFLFAASRDVQRDLAVTAIHRGYTFLFAASRDVQRDTSHRRVLAARGFGFYSLHRETYSVTLQTWRTSHLASEFLFAASRDVQRDGASFMIGYCVWLVSIRCIARRTA